MARVYINGVLCVSWSDKNTYLFYIADIWFHAFNFVLGVLFRLGYAAELTRSSSRGRAYDTQRALVLGRSGCRQEDSVKPL